MSEPGARTYPAKLIRCILPKGIAVPTLEALKADLGIITANINFARGSGKITPLADRGLGGQTEKEILTVVVDADRADEVFEYIYRTAKINRPHGGLMYLCGLAGASRFALPDLPDET